MQKILVTGGAGYVGCVLVPQLLDAGHEVVVYDVMYFGSDGLPKNDNLQIVQGNILDTQELATHLHGVDTVIHLACISNDPSFELDQTVSKQINFDCFEPLVIAAKTAGVTRFIYASTSSVYGISDAPNVTEDHQFLPLTAYNDFKGQCEPVLWKHQADDFVCVAIRPATLCGYSPRMRLDLTVNILTNHAVNNRKITVFGGEQKRPNLHINDMCDLYELLLTIPAEKIAGQAFNAGYQNLKISEIAQLVQTQVMQEMPDLGDIPIVTTPSDDNRSYHINSDKITQMLGFTPSRTVENAVRDLCAAFRAGKLPNSMNDERYYNVRRHKALEAA